MKKAIYIFFGLVFTYFNISAQATGFDVTNNIVCKGDSVYFTDTSTANVISWYWDFGDGNSSTAQNPVHLYSSDGIYDVKMIVIISGGSIDSVIKSAYINVIGSSIININSTDSVCVGGSAAIDLSLLSGLNYTSSFSWSNGSITPIIDSLSSGTYYVSTTINQCVHEDSAIIGISNSTMLDSMQVFGINASCHNNDGEAYVSISSFASNNDNFDNGSYSSSIWSIINGGIVSDICGTYNGSYALYFNGGSTRYAETKTMIFASNSIVSFYLKYGSSSSGNCESVDNGEEVQLQYSINNGVSWFVINTYNLSSHISFNKVTENIPSAALNTNTILRIQQKSNNGSCCDHWTIDEFAINNSNNSYYTFQWNDSLQQTTSHASGLTTGMYMVTVTDSFMCYKSDSVTISQSAPIATSVSQTGISCEGSSDGMAIASAQGGNIPYVFTFNSITSTDSTASNLSEGLNTLIVTDAKQCTDTLDFFVDGPNKPQMTLNITEPSCSLGNDGSISTTLTSGNTPFSYAWNNAVAQDLKDDFDNGSFNSSLWSSIIGGTPSGSCGSYSGNYALYFNSSSTRSAETIAFDFTNTSSVSFYLKFGSGSSPCENADSGDEVILSYSTNSGSTWSTVQTYYTTSYSSFTFINVTLPSAAQTTNTRLRWSQPSNSGVGYDNWSIDDIEISTLASSTDTFIDNLSNGTYELIITDSLGCAYDTTTTINNSFSVNTQTNNPSCYGINDAYISTNITNSISPTITWSNGNNTDSIGSLYAGTYYITISDSTHCDYIDTFVLTNPDSINLNSIVIDASCGLNNGTISLTPNSSTSVAGKALEMISGTGKSHNDNLYRSLNNLQPDEISFYVNSSEISLNDDSEAHNYVVIKDGSNYLLFFYMATEDNNTIPLMGPVINSNISGSVPVSGSQYVAGYAYNPGQWYHVAIKNINYSTATYDYYVDNVLAFSNVPFNSSGAISSVDQIQLYHFNPNATGYYDEILMTQNSNQVFYEDFETNLNSWNLGNGGYTNNLVQSTISPGSNIGLNYLWNNGDTSSALSALSSGIYTVTATETNSCTKVESYTINDMGTPLTTVSITNASCTGLSNGSASVSVSGGAQPYSYNWSMGSSTNINDDFDNGSFNSSLWSSVIGGTSSSSCGSYSGNYALYFDASLTRSAETKSFNFANSSSVSFYLKYGTGSSPCEDADSGDEVILSYSTNSGSTWTTIQTYYTTSYSSFTYINVTLPSAANTSNTKLKWSQPSHSGGGYDNWSIDDIEISTLASSTDSFINNLSAGTIYVTVTDANSCIATDNGVVQAFSNNLTSTISTINASCFNASDGSAQAVPSGGTTPYSFSWSTGTSGNSLNNLSAGTYTLTITDNNGCVDISQVNITSPSAIYITSTINDVSCYSGNNGTINLNVSGGSLPYSYNWNSNNNSGTSLTGLVSSFYYVTVTDADNCIETKSFYVGQPSQLNVTTSSTVASWNQNTGSATASVSGGTPSYSYLWSDGQTSNTAYSLFAATYTVTVTDDNACVVIASAVVNEDTTGMGVSYIRNAQSLKIYPNPFNVKTNLSFDNPHGLVHYFKLIDLNGSLIKFVEGINGNEYTFFKKDISAGQYIFEFGNAHYLYQGKIFIE